MVKFFAFTLACFSIQVTATELMIEPFQLAFVSNDDALFDRYTQLRFSPITRDQGPQCQGPSDLIYERKPRIRYTLQHHKNKESWTPLYSNHKVTSYWVAAL